MHDIEIRFHFTDSLEVTVRDDGNVAACDTITGARIVLAGMSIPDQPNLEPAFWSRNYGDKRPSMIACWRSRQSVPSSFQWFIVPLGRDEDDRRLDEVLNK